LTLVGEKDRRIVKQAIKKAKSVKQRKIDADLVKSAAEEIDGLKEQMAAALENEKEEKQVSHG
jgi:ATP-dependent RNA helicase DDX27